MGDPQIDTVNPYDPPERQALEQKLQDDTRIEQQVHATIQQEQHLADTVEQAGGAHPRADARIHDLESQEQQTAGYIVQDQQNIDHWDHEHPGWDQASVPDAGTQTDAGDEGTQTDAGDEGTQDI